MSAASSGRLLRHGPGSPAWNMAVDESLLRLASVPVLRLYEWGESAVSLGYFQPMEVAPPGRVWVRRYTGGGLVDHAADLTYTLVIPRGHPLAVLGTAESYALAHRGVADALCALGWHVELAACCSADEHEACFQRPVKYDVVMGQVKVAGAAQRRTRDGILHQGSILQPDSGRRMELAEALPTYLAKALDCHWEPGTLLEGEEALARELMKTRYATAAWNRMR